MTTPQHKAKLCFLMNDLAQTQPFLFFQLDDGSCVIFEITRGQLAGLAADGVKILATSSLSDNRTADRRDSSRSLSPNTEPAAHEYSAAIASASHIAPNPDADAPLSSKRKTYGAKEYPL